jgi:thiaminase/transcriptional activator TenA
VDEGHEFRGLFGVLVASTGGQWLKAQQHPFVEGLRDGTLSSESFKHFLQQDYLYLIAYSRAFAVAAAKSPQLALLETCAGLVSDTLETEMQLHRDYAREFGIGEEELASLEPCPVTQAYSDFGLAVAHQGGLLDLLVALSPCGVGYAQIGQRLRPEMGFSNGMSLHPYRKWIETYSGEEFQRYAAWMADSINELGEGIEDAAGTFTDSNQRGLTYAQRRLAELALLMRTGCRYEWLFWEMAWTNQGWPL